MTGNDQLATRRWSPATKPFAASSLINALESIGAADMISFPFPRSNGGRLLPAVVGCATWFSQRHMPVETMAMRAIVPRTVSVVV